MSRNRLVKYGKVLKFQQQQLNLIKQQIGSQNQLIDQLDQQKLQLENELVNIASQFRTDPKSAMLNLQCDQAMIAVQRKINFAKTEVATANERLDFLLHTFREKNKDLKSWEKLVQQESDKAVFARAKSEMLAADENYLSTHFAVGVAR
jgi:flagellar export protein FliJ